MNTAVLLLAYGGPTKLEDVPAYLSNVRAGRPTPQPLVDEFVERYRLIGGGSPLLSITQSLAHKLQEALCLPVYVGMRHWHPFIEDAVGEMAAWGVERAIVLCLAPHYSEMSIGAYRKRLDVALGEVYGQNSRAAAREPFAVDFVESWHLQPDYLCGIEARVRTTLERFPQPERVKVIFVAHSLPAAVVEQGDPYDIQVHETAKCLASSLGLPETAWMFAYQSAARQGVRWLGPAVEDVVREQVQAGQKDLLIAPVGFVSDHVEVLYDLDIELHAVAAEVGAHVERTPMLNDGPELVKALASIVSARLVANQK